MLEFLIALALAVGAVYFVLRPILRPELAGHAAGVGDGHDDEGEDPDDDLSPRAVALRALKEIEFDRATGKLSDGDYETLHAKYTEEALAALRAGERDPVPSGTRGAGSGVPRQPSGTAPRAPIPAQACPVHGPRPESDAEFCSECGRRLVAPAAGPGYCERCGNPLEAGARFCGRCGVNVAA